MQLELNGLRVTVRRIVDMPEGKMVRAFVSGVGQVVLWEGLVYDECVRSSFYLLSYGWGEEVREVFLYLSPCGWWEALRVVGRTA